MMFRTVELQSETFFQLFRTLFTVLSGIGQLAFYCLESSGIVT